MDHPTLCSCYPCAAAEGFTLRIGDLLESITGRAASETGPVRVVMLMRYPADKLRVIAYTSARHCCSASRMRQNYEVVKEAINVPDGLDCWREDSVIKSFRLVNR